jgi:hypothetical protein
VSGVGEPAVGLHFPAQAWAAPCDLLSAAPGPFRPGAGVAGHRRPLEPDGRHRVTDDARGRHRYVAERASGAAPRCPPSGLRSLAGLSRLHVPRAGSPEICGHACPRGPRGCASAGYDPPRPGSAHAGPPHPCRRPRQASRTARTCARGWGAASRHEKAASRASLCDLATDKLRPGRSVGACRYKPTQIRCGTGTTAPKGGRSSGSSLRGPHPRRAYCSKGLPSC